MTIKLTDTRMIIISNIAKIQNRCPNASATRLTQLFDWHGF